MYKDKGKVAWCGDYVLTENPEIGELAYKEVLQTFVRYKDKTIHVIVNGTEIETTSEHPFWVEGVGFVEEGFLRCCCHRYVW
ncbi:polymorphic toxin-type HINT domain-containing protein [Anaerosporobacter sp.]|uniref:polymorphic toxin-type HINT domain-containing protein n=1 Tax=Anaerosporobacter sp. TaxID=1872529 RepID=UPI00286F1EEB|nr:polymorphic toxin-type HINT domain-containing protein [Anaerosporobacter sp.]